MKYLAISTSREVFLPSHLNYFGLLGFGEELYQFKSVNLFYDDLVLWRTDKQVKFKLPLSV